MRGRLPRELDPEWMLRARFAVAAWKTLLLIVLGLVYGAIFAYLVSRGWMIQKPHYR